MASRCPDTIFAVVILAIFGVLAAGVFLSLASPKTEKYVDGSCPAGQSVRHARWPEGGPLGGYGIGQVCRSDDLTGGPVPSASGGTTTGGNGGGCPVPSASGSGSGSGSGRLQTITSYDLQRPTFVDVFGANYVNSASNVIKAT